MKFHKPVLLFAEIRESFSMAMGAMAAHKLRSALTLLGVLVGVFSIIVVMTAMRVMQNNIENEIGKLGDQTFMITKSPGVYLSQPKGNGKILCGEKTSRCNRACSFRNRRRCRAASGWRPLFGPAKSRPRYKKSAPDVQIYGETPGSFPAHNWNVGDGRAAA